MMSANLPRALKVAALLAALVAVPAAALAFQPAAKPAATAAAPAAEGEAGALPAGDPVRGKTVFMRVGVCSECHGWAGDGEHGKHPRSPGIAANLRETQLTPEDMAQVIRCGIPGTAMPYHLSTAYKDPEVCYGMVMDDFGGEGVPVKGKTFREKDVENVVAYIVQQFQGRGPITLADCEEILKPGDKQCDFLR